VRVERYDVNLPSGRYSHPVQIMILGQAKLIYSLLSPLWGGNPCPYIKGK